MKNIIRKILSVIMLTTLLWTNFSFINTTSAEKPEQENNNEFSCPYEWDNDWIVINFYDPSFKLLSNNEDKSKKTFNVDTIPAWEYDIYLASADWYASRVNVTQPKEQYKIIFENWQESDSTKDLKDKIAYAQWEWLVNKDFELENDSSTIKVEHPAYYDPNPNSVAPICMKLVPKEEQKITICHATTSDSNPYWPKAIEVDINSILDENWHSSHTWSVWYLWITEKWWDIIPPFDYGNWEHYDWLNWEEWKSILENDCQIQTASIHGFKWSDKDENWQINGDEEKLEGWEITIESDTYSWSVLTDENWNYSFEVPYGKYKVCETMKDWWIQTFPANNDWCYDVTINEETCPDELHNFGNFKITSGSIHGFKWNDENQNSIWELEEETMSWWNIVVSFSGWTEIYTWATNENWYYSFENLPIWNYEICEVNQEWWQQTFPNDNNWCYNINLTEEDVQDYNFGNFKNLIDEKQPECEDWKKYVKITLNEASGGLNTVDNKIWFGDKVVPVWAWFEIPNDAQTSTHTEGAVLTYDNNILTIDLLKADDDSLEDFAWTIEFYWAETTWDLVAWKTWDDFYKLEDEINCWTSCHMDVFEKSWTQKVIFDFATTNAHDEWSFEIKDKIEYCHEPLKIVAYKIICDDERELPDSFDFNWEIESDTANNWVNNYKSCYLAEWWNFQYWFDDAITPNGSFYWEASPNWNSFWTTNSNGEATAYIRDLENVGKVKIREVNQEWYIPFTDAKTNESQYSAELYCGKDITNYDNEEWITGSNLSYWSTVYCVAWNVEKWPDPLNACENDFSVNNQKDLSIINLDSGIQTKLNELEFGSSAAWSDPITWNIYYIENTTWNPKLWVYNITTHLNTVIWYTNVNKSFTKLAFSNDWTLYAMTEDSDLYKINTSDATTTYIDATPRIDKRGWDLSFDYNWDMYVIVKSWKLYKVDVTNNSTLATYLWQVKYNTTAIESTWLTFKNGLFYVTDDSNNLYSFSIDNIENAVKIANNTNNINDLASCPVPELPQEPKIWNIHGYKFNDLNNNQQIDDEPTLSWWTINISWEYYSWSTLTNENWYYSFDNIVWWEYTICETQQTWWTQTYPTNNDWCHIVDLWVSEDIDYNFANHENPTVTTTWWGGGSSSPAACVDLEINTDLWTSTWSVELTCRWNEETAMFMLDCWDWTPKQIASAIWTTSPYATFTCNYDDSSNYTPVCSVAKVNTTDPDSSNWITPIKCEWNIEFANKITTYTVEDEIVWGWSSSNEITEETDNGTWNIDDTYQDYTDKVNKLKDIEDEEEKVWKSELKALPEILLKTWTPIYKRVSEIKDNRVETEAPEMTASYVDDINMWKSKLPEEDRDRSEYIVIPSNWLVIPVSYVPEDSQDYQELINWREIDVNKYLKLWAMTYPWTSDSNYWEAWNKVLFWHSSYWKYDNGRYKTQFQKIIELDSGEEIWIYKVDQNWNYNRFVYKVEKSYETTPSDVSVLNPWVWSNLTLITCTPIGWVENRWIVKAKFVNEDKAELESYLYGKNISTKNKIKIDSLISKLETLDDKTREEVTLKIFSAILELEQKVKNNKIVSNFLDYLKLQLAISYKNNAS